jgi:formylglycine-generating enzyme required for sulfatase activity
MRRESHVRFCESGGVRFPSATRPVWSRQDGKRLVTFPARQFTVDGERRSFSLLRAVENPAAQARLRDFVMQAYQAAVADPGVVKR